jgi:Na+/H+ antiporter NhaD/arsenite permease-like protein
MMVVSAHLAEAGVFRLASRAVLARIADPRTLFVAVVFGAGISSALLVNDTVCLMATPVVLQLVRDARLKPLPFLLALAFGANAGSAATPTGNPQNMLVATLGHVSYGRFTGLLALPALASLATVAMVGLWTFRSELSNESLRAHDDGPVDVDRRLAVWSLATLVLVMAAFLAGASMAWTAMGGAALLLVVGRVKPEAVFGRVDFVLLVFFAALFVVVDGVGRSGLAGAMFERLAPSMGTTPGAQFVSFSAFTLGVSQLVSNVPFVLLAAKWMDRLADPRLSWLVTALVSTLAGNLTPIGSVANVIVLEGAGAEGRVPLKDFLRASVPVTAATLVVGGGLLWLEHLAGWL